jgi:benzoate/toluate 1,2-dioxygenase beta subunit
VAPISLQRIFQTGSLQVLHLRYKTSYSYFGMSRYEIDFSGEKPQILSKYVVLKNDYINQVIDVYHL